MTGIDGGIGNPGERTGNVGQIDVNGELQECD